MLVADPAHGVAEALLLQGQGLALGDGVADDVTLADPAEGGDLVPGGGHGAVGVEGEVPGEGSATKAPFSPVTTVTRSLKGVSQLTVWETMTPLARRPVASTMSSFSRPERWAPRAWTDA